MAETWITCHDCGEKVLSSRHSPDELLEIHRAVCPLRPRAVIDLRDGAAVEQAEPVTQ